MKVFLGVLVLLLLCAGVGGAGASDEPVLAWQKCLGGTGTDSTGDVQQTADGGFIVAGATASNDGNVAGFHGGGGDAWVVKLNGAGGLVWQVCLGGTGTDWAGGVQQTADGGFIVAGATASNDGNVAGFHGGGGDAWVVKLNGAGGLVWQKCLGGSGDDGAFDVDQTTDGGYIVAGSTTSNDGDVSGNHGDGDAWVVKLDASGNPVWQKCLGGSSGDTASAIHQTSDGGYIMAGRQTSFDTADGGEFWVVKLNAAGTQVWQTFVNVQRPVYSWEHATAVEQTTDGSYIAAGYVEEELAGMEDAMVVKLDTNGNLVWKHEFGSSYPGTEYVHGIQQTTDGGCIVSGETDSYTGDFSSNHGYFDAWVVKLDAGGNPVWHKLLGGSGVEGAVAVRQTADGGFIVVGTTGSNDGDVTGNHGWDDIWVVRLGTPLIVNFKGVPRIGYAPLTVQFSDGTAGNPTGWEWSFGDGGTSTAQNPLHTYANPGVYPVTLEASKALWINATSRYHYITVLPLTGPFTIQAEDYDEGGEGKAYHDASAGNQGGAYRSDDVDISDISILGSAYVISAINNGEWTQYTVPSAAAQDHDYTLTLRVSARTTGEQVLVEVDGFDKVTVDLPNTGSLSGFTDVTTTVRLHPGTNTIRFTYFGDYMNFDYFVLDPGEIVPLQTFPGGSGMPTDTDGDGLWDDVNGNGRKDFADVVLYFNQMTWIVDHEPATAFDYNRNDRIDFADVVWLFNQL